ncbi:MAG TPA: hypothetical protein VHM90_21260 [Phycisphaerae bacterium]|jgi:hypothetical protein|nr:hypothetical protein [Phycisphaerae bacterium]
MKNLRRTMAYLLLGGAVGAGISRHASGQQTPPAATATSPAPIQLKATPKTVAWGYYDAAAAPVLRIKSGDRVEI